MPYKNGTCNECNNKTSSVKYTICVNCRKVKNKRKIPLDQYARNWHLIKKYNIDSDGFNVLWQAFKGKCGICNINLQMPQNGKGQPRNAAVIDHDHVSGNLRGLLCNSCNKALGLFNDDVILLRSAMNWIGYSNAKACVD